MYKDILNELNTDRRIDSKFMERLERNGFEIYYGQYSYWNNQEYILVGTKEIWLVETYNTNNSGTGCCYRYRNDVAEEIKTALEVEKKKLEKEKQLIDSVLPIE